MRIVVGISQGKDRSNLIETFGSSDVFGNLTHFVDTKNTERTEYDQQIANILKQEEVDLIVLVGYMRLFSEWFVNEYEHKIINVHPSLLPEFPGMDTNVHQAVLDAGRKKTGCTFHFVDAGMDTGPIILQKEVEVADDETVDSLKDKVQSIEKEWYPKVIQWIADGKVKVENGVVEIME